MDNDTTPQSVISSEVEITGTINSSGSIRIDGKLEGELHCTGDAVIGAWCTIGHAAIVHACTIEDECLIGMGATILDRARIGARSIVGAGALVTQDFTCPPGSLVLGAPAKIARQLSEKEQAGLRHWAEKYVEVSRAHAAREKSGRSV